MTSVTLILIAVCGVALGLIYASEAREIILNENDLIGTCTKTCEEVQTLYDKNRCKRISSCRTSSTGWNKGFVRCDYCRCECEVDDTNKDVVVERKHLSITEPELLGTCTTNCDKRGLVRTNFHGCEEIRDCWRANTGWTRGFVRCDYCTCNCVNRKYAQEYRLENIKYDFSEADLQELEDGKPSIVAETILQNEGNQPQEATRVLRYTVTESTSVSMTHNTEVGLTVTVGASAGIEGIGELITSVSQSISYGFSYTSGSTKTEENTDEIQVAVSVPPKSSVKAVVIGNEFEIDIPYTATLVTVHEDDSESRKRVTGILTDVHTARIRVNYEAAQPLQG